MRSKRARMPPSVRCWSAVFWRRGRHHRDRPAGRGQRIEQFVDAALQRQAVLQHGVAFLGEAGVDPRQRQAVAVMRDQQPLAFRPRPADHRAADGVDVGIAEPGQHRGQAFDIDPLGIDQRAVHVEQHRLDLPLICDVRHPTAARRANGVSEVWAPGAGSRRTGSRRRRPGSAASSLWSAHQQSLDRVQANSAPHCAQISRRAAGAGMSLRWLISGSPLATPQRDRRVTDGTIKCRRDAVIAAFGRMR